MVAKTKRLTQAEKQWINDLQDVLNACPSGRLGFYTIGDSAVIIFDRPVRDAWCQANGDTATDIQAELTNSGADLDAFLTFPEQVESRAG